MKEDKYYLTAFQVEQLEKVIEKLDNALVDLITVVSVLKHPARIKDEI